MLPPSFHHPTKLPFQQSHLKLKLETMKQSFHSGAIVFLCIFFLISSSALSARLLANKEGQHEEAKLNEITNGGSLVGEGNELMNELMGVEDCADGDEDCFKKRLMAEAHLDYIYTQHHKP